jgi:hypothetical protein
MALPKRQLTPENAAEPILERCATQDLRNLNFKVPPEFRKRFARRAVEDDLSQVELLRRAFAAYEAQQSDH